jgi:hypothetical protein
MSQLSTVERIGAVPFIASPFNAEQEGKVGRRNGKHVGIFRVSDSRSPVERTCRTGALLLRHSTQNF